MQELALIEAENVKEELPYKCVLALCPESDAPKFAESKVTSLKVLTTSVWSKSVFFKTSPVLIIDLTVPAAPDPPVSSLTKLIGSPTA